MENIDSTEWEKKNNRAAMREKYDGRISDLQAKLDAEIAGRAADKKLYFTNTMKARGYEWDFTEFADKYAGLDINDMVALYEWQNPKAQNTTVAPTTTEQHATEQIWAKSVIAWANPTTEVGGKKLEEMSTDELIKFAKTQPWYHW